MRQRVIRVIHSTTGDSIGRHVNGRNPFMLKRNVASDAIAKEQTSCIIQMRQAGARLQKTKRKRQYYLQAPGMCHVAQLGSTPHTLRQPTLFHSHATHTHTPEVIMHKSTTLQVNTSLLMI